MIVSSQTTAAEAPTIIAAQQAAWAQALAEVGPSVAAASTLREQLGDAMVVQLVGVETATAYADLARQFVAMYQVARQLDRGDAVMVAWHDADAQGTPTSPTFLGVILKSAIPRGTLAGWPLLILGGGVVIAALLWKHWDVDVERMRQQNRAVENEARRRLSEQAESLRTTDPNAWAQLQTAMQNATAASAQAAADPVGFFDRLLQGVGAVGGGAAGGLVVLGILWWLSQPKEAA